MCRTAELTLQLEKGPTSQAQGLRQSVQYFVQRTNCISYCSRSLSLSHFSSPTPRVTGRLHPATQSGMGRLQVISGPCADTVGAWDDGVRPGCNV